MSKVAILVPAYQRPEYTSLCLKSIKEAQEYPEATFYYVDEGDNAEVFSNFGRPQDIISLHNNPIGLRNTIIEFFDWAKTQDIKYISKVDNDCLVPRNWLNKLVNILETTDANIISPNVSETQAAFKYGKDDTYELGFRPSTFVGGLWTMEMRFIKNLFFERADTSGIRGAFALLHQIIHLNDPRPFVGWTEEVTFEDIGHWGGTHPKHIKNEAHFRYSAEVGRPIGWDMEACK